VIFPPLGIAAWIIGHKERKKVQNGEYLPSGSVTAGYVLGMLAAARDDLRFEISGDRAYVFPREGARVVMHKGSDGAFRIVLRDSVPENVRRGLLQVEENARTRRVPAGP